MFYLTLYRWTDLLLLELNNQTVMQFITYNIQEVKIVIKVNRFWTFLFLCQQSVKYNIVFILSFFRCRNVNYKTNYIWHTIRYRVWADIVTYLLTLGEGLFGWLDSPNQHYIAAKNMIFMLTLWYVLEGMAHYAGQLLLRASTMAFFALLAKKGLNMLFLRVLGIFWCSVVRLVTFSCYLYDF